MSILKDIIRESVTSFLYTVKSNVYNLGVLIYLCCPYIVLLLIIRSHTHIVVLLILPMLMYLISSILRRIGNKTNNGNELPIPRKRYTEEQEDGEVYIKKEDLQEVILYLNEVENYLVRKGKL